MADRNSVVSMADNTIIAYPIENHAYQLSDEMMKNFINDIVLMATNKPVEPTNLKNFCELVLVRHFIVNIFDHTMKRSGVVH